MGTKRRRGCLGRLFQLAFVAILVVLLLPGVLMFYLQDNPPPFSGTMLQRSMESRAKGDGEARIRQEWVKLDEISPAFVHAVWVSEDARFFSHDGFDWIEIAAARAEAKRRGTKPRGASTITMQTARTLFLWQGRSWIRKGLETYFTFWMELVLSKKRILELYVNSIEMGPGVYGVGAAAEYYFKKPASQLSEREAAALVSILPNPRMWAPFDNHTTVQARQRRILQKVQSSTFPIGELN